MFTQYPYLNLNDFNLDYILKAIKDMRYEVTNFVSINAIKYADPIQWNITSQYEKNTIVIDPVTGTAYISVAPVPAGVALTRPEYWTVVFDLQSFVTKANQNLAHNYESQTTTTATMNTTAGAWIIWGDVLYKALVNITAGDAYVVGSNLQRVVIEDVINAILQDIADEAQARLDADAAIVNIIGDLDNLTTSDKTNIVNAINDEVSARQGADTTLQGNIDAEVLARQNADGTLQGNIDAEVLARQNADGNLSQLDTTNKNNLVSAINEVNGKITALPQKRIVVITDSYGVSHESAVPFTTTLQSLLGLSNSDYYAYAEGSLGFVVQGLSGHNAQELLTLHANDISDPDTISHVLFILGGNDYNSLSSLNAAIASCFNYVRTTYPKAKIVVGFSYNRKIKDAAWTNALPACIAAYSEYVINNGGDWINNFMYIMHNATFFVSDNVHPNTAGNNAMARAIYSYLNSGTCDVKYFTTATATSTSGTQTFAVRMMIDNEIASISGSFVTDQLTVTNGVNEIVVGTITPLLFAGAYGTCYCPTRIQLSTGEIFPCNMALEGGDVRLSFRSNVAGTVAAGTFVPFTGVPWSTLLT